MDKDHTGFHEWHKTQSAKVLFIDSKDATAQHDGTTHFTYVFRDTIQVKKNEGVLVSLLQASIPYSFYNCREGVNDKIDILYSPANATSKNRDGGLRALNSSRELHGDLARKPNQEHTRKLYERPTPHGTQPRWRGRHDGVNHHDGLRS